MSNTNKTPFSDKELYNMSVIQAYEMKDIKKNDVITKNGLTYTVIDIQHDTQTGFDAMAVKDDKGNIII